MRGDTAQTSETPDAAGGSPRDVPVEVVVNFISDGGYYPRARGEDPTLDYWRAMAVMAATLRIVGVDWPITISTNAPPVDAAVLSSLEASGVAFRDTPYLHRPPPDFFDRFNGTFYFIDALADAIERNQPGSRILVLDPDIVWVRSPEPIIAALDADPDLIMAYQISYSQGQPAMGLTHEEMGAFFNEIGERPTPAKAPHAGGEFLFGERDRLAELLPHLEYIYEEGIRRYHDGNRIRANTEEHALSYALGQLGWTEGSANGFVRRLWTKLPPNRNIQGDEKSLIAWHCLTEKGVGLNVVFDDLVENHPALQEAGEEYRRHLARRLRVDLGLKGLIKWPISKVIHRKARTYPPEW